MDRWLADLFTWESHPELVTWVGRYLFLAPIQRAFVPGIKLDETPVLIGPQGCGKSALTKGLVPDPAWHSDAVDFAARDRELVESMQGRVVIELGEMAGVGRRELSTLKAFLTRTDDGQHRMAYARHAVEAPRRCIFVGTANAASLPNDPTGNRRFVAIQTKDKRATCRVETYMDAHRDTLYAAALARFTFEGWTANLPYALAEAQGRANEAARVGDEMVEEIVAEYLAKAKELTLERVVQEVTERCLGNASPAPQFKRRWKRKGWKARRLFRDGRQRRVWIEA